MNVKLPKYNIIKDYVLTNFKLAYNFDNTLSEFYIPYSNNYDSEFEKIYSKEPIFFEWKGFKFPIFIHNNESELFTKEGKISFDISLNIFLFLSGYLELISNKKDNHDRFPYKESLQSKYGFVTIPVVNIYFELIFHSVSENNISITRKNFKNSIVFTHDVDQLRSGWFENIQYHISNFSLKSFFAIPKNIVTKIFKLEDDYLTGMKRMLSIDSKNGIEAISFYIPKKSKMDADFDLFESKYYNLFKHTEKNQTIGVHPGYETFNKPEEFIRQVNEIEKISKSNITKSRQHYLRYDMQITPLIIERSNITDDFTLGFAEQYGFRNGIANPFYLFNFENQVSFNFKSFPLVFMDVNLMNYELEKDFDSAYIFLKNIISNFNCNFSILFHNSVFSSEKYNGFEKFYLKIIELTKK